MPNPITVDRKGLLDAINTIKVACSRPGSGSPAFLTGVQIVPHGNSLAISATDLDVHKTRWVRGISRRAAASVDQTLVVRPVPLAGFLSKLKDRRVDLDLTDATTLKVAAGGSAGSFAALPVDEERPWPSQEFNETATFKINPEMGEALPRIAYAASKEVFRPTLNMMWLDGTYAVTTDSYRLAWIGPFRPLPTLNIPARPFAAAMQHCPDGDLHICDGRVCYIDANRTATTLLAGPPDHPNPDWKKLIWGGKKYSKTTIDRKATIDALQIIAGFKPTIEPVRLKWKSGSIQLTLVQNGVEAFKTTAPATGMLKEPLAFNHLFLLEALNACRGDEVDLEWISSKDPMRIREDDFGSLLMPIRVDALSKK